MTAKVPPLDTNGEVEKSYKLLKQFRKALEKSSLPVEWWYYVAESLVKGLPPVEDDVP